MHTSGELVEVLLGRAVGTTFVGITWYNYDYERTSLEVRHKWHPWEISNLDVS